jgi:hypothetical protein
MSCSTKLRGSGHTAVSDACPAPAQIDSYQMELHVRRPDASGWVEIEAPELEGHLRKAHSSHDGSPLPYVRCMISLPIHLRISLFTYARLWGTGILRTDLC